jgi:hypothetical protein
VHGKGRECGKRQYCTAQIRKQIIGCGNCHSIENALRADFFFKKNYNTNLKVLR